MDEDFRKAALDYHRLPRPELLDSDQIVAAAVLIELVKETNTEIVDAEIVE